MDETGIHINNHPGKVVATKGSKVQVKTASEKDVFVIAFINAEGLFPPVQIILKGVRKNPDHLRSSHPGSNIYMNPRSSINSDFFVA